LCGVGNKAKGLGAKKNRMGGDAGRQSLGSCEGEAVVARSKSRAAVHV